MIWLLLPLIVIVALELIDGLRAWRRIVRA